MSSGDLEQSLRADVEAYVGGRGLDAEVARVAQVLGDGDGQRRVRRGGGLFEPLAHPREGFVELRAQTLQLLLQTAGALRDV